MAARALRACASTAGRPFPSEAGTCAAFWIPANFMRTSSCRRLEELIESMEGALRPDESGRAPGRAPKRGVPQFRIRRLPQPHPCRTKKIQRPRHLRLPLCASKRVGGSVDESRVVQCVTIVTEPLGPEWAGLLPCNRMLSLKLSTRLIGPLAVLFGFVLRRFDRNACAIPVRRSGVYAR
jgi:hypothetical protein